MSRMKLQSWVVNDQQYINPPVECRTETIFKDYSKIKQMRQTLQSDLFQSSDLSNQLFEIDVKYARFPIQKYCKKCQIVSMTEIQYKHGISSIFWTIILTPFLCLGICCLCNNTCKDVIHVCPQCSENIGISQSQIC